MALGSSDWLALVALLISLIALVTTVLQVLQQYFSSAEGFRRCADSVMGVWANGTHRKFRRSELRFEVVFETPVLFMARPTNKYGPIPGREIFYMDGTKKSYDDTRVLEPNAQDVADQQARARVHTADDERASWVTLLLSLQREERDSRAWDSKNSRTPKGKLYHPPDYNLAVGLQPKVRSWDFMPTAVSRPFATTTISHLIEMVAVLGMYWKLFDQMNWNLRAEGNGFIVTSTQVSGLGLMVTFSVTGKSFFEENRLIPNDVCKEIVFGVVNTFYKDVVDIHVPKEAPKELTFGNSEEIVQTLTTLGVSPENIHRYEKKHKHLFPISFEIIFMLAVPVRLRGSNFKRVPNPTTDYYIANFNKKTLVEEFQAKLCRTTGSDTINRSEQIDGILTAWSDIKQYWHNDGDEIRFDIDLRESLHDALDASTAYLLSQESKLVIRVLAAHLNAVISTLDTLEPQLNELDARKEEAFIDHYFTVIKPVVLRSRRKSEVPGKGEKDERGSIWMTLVWRGLCWMLLHDFDKVDKKVVPSDLKGSRMPVFIG